MPQQNWQKKVCIMARVHRFPQLPEKISFANLPTPIQKLNRLSKEVGKEIFVWRDDLTGFVESGNKVRKLEFLVSEAIQKQADTLITCGGIQSNHARATAYVARRAGLDVSLILRDPRDPSIMSQSTISGNLLLNQLCRAHIIHVPYNDYLAAGSSYTSFLEQEALRLKIKCKNPYIIPEGGSSPLGCLGYAAAVPEMLHTWQNVTGEKAPDALFFAVGSGGTYAGLHLGFQLNGLSTEKLYAINICDNAEYFNDKVTGLLDAATEQFHFDATDRYMQILDGYVGQGYALATDDDLLFYSKIASEEGLLLDPVYTGKAFQGMINEIKKNPSRFGKKILFLHSGGTFATFAFSERYAKLTAFSSSK